MGETSPILYVLGQIHTHTHINTHCLLLCRCCFPSGELKTLLLINSLPISILVALCQHFLYKKNLNGLGSCEFALVGLWVPVHVFVLVSETKRRCLVLTPSQIHEREDGVDWLGEFNWLFALSTYKISHRHF